MKSFDDDDGGGRIGQEGRGLKGMPPVTDQCGFMKDVVLGCSRTLGMYIGSLLLLYRDHISCLPFSLCFSLAPLHTPCLSSIVLHLSFFLQISSDPHRRYHHCHQGMCNGNLIGGRTRLGGGEVLGGHCRHVPPPPPPPKLKKKKFLCKVLQQHVHS